MTLETDTAEAPTTETEGNSLVTGGEQREPDKGPGDKEPDKGEGDKTADKPSEGDKAEGEAPAGAPEAYADFTAPEGIELDAEVTEAFKADARELNLTQDQAQKLIDRAVELQGKWAEGQVGAIDEAVKASGGALVPTAIREEWVTQAKADTEFGGAKLDESLATAKRALEAYGSPKLAELLDKSGLGNNPEIIRLLVKAGKTVSEDSYVGGTSRDGKAKDAASQLYPNQQAAS